MEYKKENPGHELINDNRHQQMVLAEYTAIHTSLNNFWTQRASILGFGTTLLLALFGFLQKADNSLRIIGEDSIPFIVWVLAKMLGALSKGTFLFTFRMREVAESDNVYGLWTVFPYFVNRNPSISGTAPYRFFCYLLNFGMGIAILVPRMPLFIDNNSDLIGNISYKLQFICIAIMLICNIYTIREELNTKVFLKKLREDWENSKLESCKKNAFPAPKKLKRKVKLRIGICRARLARRFKSSSSRLS